MQGFNEKICPRCRQAAMKQWKDLSDEEKFLAERLPMSATRARRERETHLFCPRCWNEEADETIRHC